MSSVNSVNNFQNYSNLQNFQSRQNKNAVTFGQYSEPVGGKDEPKPEKAVLALLLLQLAASGLEKASRWCGDKLMAGKEFAPAQDVVKVAQRMVGDNKLNVDVQFVNPHNIRKFPEALRDSLVKVARGENAFYNDAFKLAVAPEKKPSLILHELGHAINSTKGKLLKFMQKSRIYKAYVPTAVLMATQMADESGIKSDFIKNNAGIIGFLSFLPTILEEGLASLRGIKAAKKVLGKAANLAPLKRNYFTAWLTYLIAGLGVGVASKMAVLSGGNPNNK